MPRKKERNAEKFNTTHQRFRTPNAHFFAFGSLFQYKIYKQERESRWGIKALREIRYQNTRAENWEVHNNRSTCVYIEEYKKLTHSD